MEDFGLLGGGTGLLAVLAVLVFFLKKRLRGGGESSLLAGAKDRLVDVEKTLIMRKLPELMRDDSIFTDRIAGEVKKARIIMAAEQVVTPQDQRIEDVRIKADTE